MSWLPFALLWLASLLGACLLFHWMARADKEWSEEREATRRLRLIQGEGADVHPFRRGA